MDFLMQTIKQSYWETFSKGSIIMGVARRLQSVVRSTNLIVDRSLLGVKTELNKH